MTAVVKSIRTIGCDARGRSGKLLILRLTPRGTRRPRLLGLSQSFSDWCASCMRGQHGPTLGYGRGFQTAEFLSMIVPKQVRQSATGSQIVRGKTLRQALAKAGYRVDEIDLVQDRRKRDRGS
jgi:hypothetical protein